MGISETQFWEMNPARLKPYTKAKEIKREKENFNAWLYGLYTYNALSSALSGFSGNGRPYLKEPIPFDAERKKEERMKRQFANFVEGLKGKNLCQT